MGLTVSVAPSIEPVTLQEVKNHIRADSGTYADATASTVSIAPDAWPITASYGIVGAWVDVTNKSALASITVGTVAATATLDAKIQESTDGVTLSGDWTGGAFTQITAAGSYEKQYTGSKSYIRVVATVALGAIDFGCSIITQNYLTTDDTYLSSLITAAREWCEEYQHRAYITRTYKLTLDDWPDAPFDLPMPPAIAISGITYTDSAGTVTAWTASEYQLDATGFVGRLTPAYGYSWPSVTLRELAGIEITYTAGYGATAASVPNRVKQAILLLVADMYENREDSNTYAQFAHSVSVLHGAESLLGQDKVYTV